MRERAHRAGGEACVHGGEAQLAEPPVGANADDALEHPVAQIGGDGEEESEEKQGGQAAAGEEARGGVLPAQEGRAAEHSAVHAERGRPH